MPKPFGGVEYSFQGRKETMEEIFGKEEISTTEMTKKLWEFIRKYDLKVK